VPSFEGYRDRPLLIFEVWAAYKIGPPKVDNMSLALALRPTLKSRCILIDGWNKAKREPRLGISRVVIFCFHTGQQRRCLTLAA
jgi:hypothetical protein